MSNLVYQVPLECSRGTDGRTVIRPSEGKYPPSHPLGRLCPSSSTSSGYFSRTLRGGPSRAANTRLVLPGVKELRMSRVWTPFVNRIGSAIRPGIVAVFGHRAIGNHALAS